MTTEETTSTEEDCVIWLKALKEKANNGFRVFIDFLQRYMNKNTTNAKPFYNMQSILEIF